MVHRWDVSSLLYERQYPFYLFLYRPPVLRQFPLIHATRERQRSPVFLANLQRIHTGRPFKRPMACYAGFDKQRKQDLRVSVTVHPYDLNAMPIQVIDHAFISRQHEFSEMLWRDERTGFTCHVFEEIEIVNIQFRNGSFSNFDEEIREEIHRLVEQLGLIVEGKREVLRAHPPP